MFQQEGSRLFSYQKNNQINGGTTTGKKFQGTWNTWNFNALQFGSRDEAINQILISSRSILEQFSVEQWESFRLYSMVQLSVDVAAQDEDPGAVTLPLVFSQRYPTPCISSLSQECVALLFPPRALSQAHQSCSGFRTRSLTKCLSLSLSLLHIHGLAGSSLGARKTSQRRSECSPFPIPKFSCSPAALSPLVLPTFQGWSTWILGQDWSLCHGICAVIPEPHPWPLLSIKAVTSKDFIAGFFFFLLIKRIKEVENFSVFCLFAKSTQLAGKKEGSHWALGENFLG